MRRNIAYAAIGVVIMGLILGVIVTVVNTNTVVEIIQSSQKDNTVRTKEAVATTARIEDLTEAIESCTTPTGACYLRNLDATGSAVASINEVIIYAAACAKTPGIDTALQVRTCVKQAIALDARRP